MGLQCLLADTSNEEEEEEEEKEVEEEEEEEGMAEAPHSAKSSWSPFLQKPRGEVRYA